MVGCAGDAGDVLRGVLALLQHHLLRLPLRYSTLAAKTGTKLFYCSSSRKSITYFILESQDVE